MCQKKHPRLGIPFFFPYPTPGQILIPAIPLCGGCCIHRWGDLVKKEPGGGNPNFQETWSPRGFQSSSSRETHPLGAVSVVSFRRTPWDLGGCGPMQRSRACQVHGARAHWLGIFVPGLSAHDSHHFWEPSLPRLQGCTWPRAQAWGNKVYSLFIICILYSCRGALRCSRVCLF